MLVESIQAKLHSEFLWCVQPSLFMLCGFEHDYDDERFRVLQYRQLLYP